MTQLMLPPAREWLTAAEAAEQSLPGFQFDERHIRRLIATGDIATRMRKAASGRPGKEFHWTSLPRAAREEYLKRHGAVEDASTANDVRVTAVGKDLKAEARKQIVDAAAAYVADHASPKLQSLARFCTNYRVQKVKLDDWIFRVEPQVTVQQLRTWERKIRTKGAGSLIDGRGRPDGTGAIENDTPLRNYIVAAVAARPHLSAPLLLSAIITDLRRTIPLRTLQSFLAKFRSDNAPVLKALTDPDRYRSHHKPAFGSRSAAIVRINQRWELDATRGDAMCRLEDGSRVRYALTCVIDVFTRRAMLLVSDQPRARATQALLRRAILAWGMPETIKADNGKEFVARAVKRFCEDAGIKLEFSRPFCPEEKPHVERFFKTLSHGLFPVLDGYVGHNVADRKAIENRASFQHRFGEEAELVLSTTLSPFALQARVDAWLRNIYEANVHSGIAQPPRDKALSAAADVRRCPDERALDALLWDAPDQSGLRIVAKRGVRVESRWYIAAELGAHMGSHVHVRIDPTDTARAVIYTHDRAAFLCVAEDADAITSERRIQIAGQAQSLDRKKLTVIRNDARTVQRQFPAAGLAERILIANQSQDIPLAPDAAEAMRAAARPQLVAHRAALDALEAAKQPEQPIELTQEQREGAAIVMAEFDARSAPPPVSLAQCDGYQRPAFTGDDVGFWLWAQARFASGELVDAEDRREIARLTTDRTFQQLLEIHLKRARAAGAA